MSIKGKRVIYVGAAGDNNSKPLTDEGRAETGMLPGTIVQVDAASGDFEVSATAITVTGVPVYIADVDNMRQKGVDDAWVIAENMVALRPRSGEFFNVLVATGQVLLKGVTPLGRNGAGLLTIATPATDNVLFYAEETITTSGTELVCVSPAMTGA